MGIVWILGAGFSRPLGGPLLGKMLSPESQRDLGVRYPRAPLWAPQAKAALWLYQYGRAGRKDNAILSRGDGQHHEGEELWEDAEQYLDFLDTAAEKGAGSPACERLLQILGDPRVGFFELPYGHASLKLIAAAGRRLIAAECCAFLEGLDPDSERWSPYQRWLGQVFTWGEDTVVTFNYDLVPEMLAQSRGMRDFFQYRTKQPSQSLLLKLHGSVNWVRLYNERGEPDGLDTNAGIRAAIEREDRDLAIAGPGPSKKAFSGGSFAWCWTEAVAALEQATAVVFVGYRFPPTDAEARERLLGAIRRNNQQHLAIHTVLGPDVSSNDSRRLRGLVEHALAGVRRPAAAIAERYDPLKTDGRWYSLEQQPLWAEDFLSVVDRRSILYPFRQLQNWT